MKINKKVTKWEPWVKTELLMALRQKAKVLVKKIRKPIEIIKLKFREFNNDFNRSKSKCKVNYYKQIFEENKDDIKKIMD